MFAYAKPEQKKASESIVQKEEMKKPAVAPNLTGIPDTMKLQFESMSGFSFGDVRVHYNSEKPVQLQALAYTQGNQVYVAPGQEKQLGHELGHVVQQKQGIVPESKLFKGINLEQRFEKEADQIAVATLNEPVHNYDLKLRQTNITNPFLKQFSKTGGSFDIAQETRVYNVLGSTDDRDTNPLTSAISSWLDKWKFVTGDTKRCYVTGSARSNGEVICNSHYLGGHCVMSADKAEHPGENDVFILPLCGKHNHHSNTAEMIVCKDTKGLKLEEYNP